MLGLTDKNFRAILKSMLKDMREDTLTKKDKIGNRDIEIIQ